MERGGFSMIRWFASRNQNISTRQVEELVHKLSKARLKAAPSFAFYHDPDLPCAFAPCRLFSKQSIHIKKRAWLRKRLGRDSKE